MSCVPQISDLFDILSGCNNAFGGVLGIKLQPLTGGNAIEIDFNKFDGFTNGAEEKSVSPDGSVSNTQTLVVELPKITQEKLTQVKAISSANMEFKAMVLSKSGQMITLGNTFGVMVNTVDTSSGSSRQEKNRIQITFTGDEVELAPIVDNGKAAWDAIPTVPETVIALASTQAVKKGE